MFHRFMLTCSFFIAIALAACDDEPTDDAEPDDDIFERIGDLSISVKLEESGVVAKILSCGFVDGDITLSAFRDQFPAELSYREAIGEETIHFTFVLQTVQAPDVAECFREAMLGLGAVP